MAGFWRPARIFSNLSEKSYLGQTMLFSFSLFILKLGEMNWDYFKLNRLSTLVLPGPDLPTSHVSLTPIATTTAKVTIGCYSFTVSLTLSSSIYICALHTFSLSFWWRLSPAKPKRQKLSLISSLLPEKSCSVVFDILLGCLSFRRGIVPGKGQTASPSSRR